jgi:phospholipase C
MTALTRRRFLGGAAAGAGAASLALLPVSVQKALATTPTRAPRMRDIEHVVLLMQENRSFDHYFGTLSGVAGFDDPKAMKLPSGRSVFYQPDPVSSAGYLLPFHLDTKSTNAQAMPSTSHSWSTQHAAWNHGAMDSWLPAHRSADRQNAPYVMGYYTREDIPFQYALADAFTICDQYHSSVMGPTVPNRMYWMTGSIDADAKHGGPVTTDRVPYNGYRWKTYAERLQAAGVPWKVYQEADSYNCAVLENFATFRHAPKYSPLHKNGLAICADGQFEYDAKHDKLPAVSWLIPTESQCEHPKHLPAAGADYVASKIAAIASNPDVWAKTAFILNYDENDGLFDHVAPPTPRAKTAQEFVKGVPIGAGYRVPCIVISPWTAGGWVASEKFDHTSVLRFLERFTGVREANISAWRRATFGDLTSTFRFAQAVHRPPSLPKTSAQLAQAEHAAAHYPPPHLGAQAQHVPHQERGGRRRT